MAKKRAHGDDLRGASRLAVEATRAVTDLVQAMHVTIAGGPAILGRPLEAPARLLTAPVYGSIRAVTRLVGAGIDQALAQLGPMLGDSAPGPEREAVLSALNGVLGDYLAQSDNPLAIKMQLRRDGQALVLERDALRLALPAAGGKVLVLVHGSGMNDRQWARRGHGHGAALARDLGYTPVYLHYNSGLHISTNGRELAGVVEQLVQAWPLPIEELAILAFSMGGLVARSACLVAEADHMRWRECLDAMVFLGTPHHGAPLERGGHVFQLLLGISRYSAPLAVLGKIRSAGVTDMRFGAVRDEDWRGRDRFARGGDMRAPAPLPAGVRCFALAATTASQLRAKLPGDGLVPVDSALGRHREPGHTLVFPESRQWIGLGMGHLDLLDRPEAYEAIRSYLSSAS